MEKKSASINKKRVRSTNFSFSEKELLLKFALQKKRVLENKESNAVSWNDKNRAWVEIAEKYNAATLDCPRDPTNLKQKYESIKKMLRGSKKTLFETVGGPHVKPYEAQSDLENELYSIIRISAEGLPCNFDSDVPIQTSTENLVEEYVVNEEEFDDNAPLTHEHNISFTNLIKEFPTATSSSLHDIDTVEVDLNKESYFTDANQEQHNNQNNSSWSPLNSTKMLRTTLKNTKLLSNNSYQKPSNTKKHCMTSAGEKFENLAETKMELVSLQQQLVRQEILQSSIEHETKLKYMAEEHALKLEILRIELEMKKKFN
ncbi:fibrinogen silencer-binding protein-like [Aphis gossypii]|uniref:fibrinogen silencer-binding protein-like n=1 Tax=Aphis gossypii TaxID=80765 RepID=UPI0021597EB3|nr:fibrinogen silencer-binding protein-like [Aphis gossypii]